MSTHKILSFIKSTIRIFGYVTLSLAFPLNEMIFFAAVILVFSEVIGVIEEVGEK